MLMCENDVIGTCVKINIDFIKCFITTDLNVWD